MSRHRGIRAELEDYYDEYDDDDDYYEDEDNYYYGDEDDENEYVPSSKPSSTPFRFDQEEAIASKKLTEEEREMQLSFVLGLLDFDESSGLSPHSNQITRARVKQMLHHYDYDTESVFEFFMKKDFSAIDLQTAASTKPPTSTSTTPQKACNGSGSAAIKRAASESGLERSVSFSNLRNGKKSGSSLDLTGLVRSPSLQRVNSGSMSAIRQRCLSEEDWRDMAPTEEDSEAFERMQEQVPLTFVINFSKHGLTLLFWVKGGDHNGRSGSRRRR